MAFDLELRLPILFASGAGVHRMTDRGASWTMTGAARDAFKPP